MNYQKKLKKVKRIYSFWGRFSFLYNFQDLFTFLGRANTIRSEAVKNLNLKNGDKVLEIACGSGRNFSYLYNCVSQTGKIYGLDYSKEMLNAAKKLVLKNKWNNVNLSQGDAANFNFKIKFDGIISILGISAIPDWKKTLKNCKSHLKKGGTLVICDARLFTGSLKFLNPLIDLIYSNFASWDPSKDVIKELNTLFDKVKIKKYNLGTLFIAIVNN